MEKQSFQINHSWGDPREPEYKNGYLIIRIYYKEESNQASFILYANKENSNGIDWILEAPADLRKNLGNLWRNRTIVFDRIFSYLKQIDSSENWRVQENRFLAVPEKNIFTNIVVDTSRVKGWLKTRLEILDTKLLPITYSLPSKNTFPPLAFGFILVSMTKLSSINLEPNTGLIIFLKILSVSAMTLLVRDIVNDYKISTLIFLSRLVSNPHFNWRVKALAQTMKIFGRRYFVTLCLAILLFNMYANS